MPVIDFGNAKVLKVNPTNGNLVGLRYCHRLRVGLNALTFDQQGNVYISDSFSKESSGKRAPEAAPAVAWVTSALLTTVRAYRGSGANRRRIWPQGVQFALRRQHGQRHNR